MNVIEMVNDIAKNLVQFSEEIKESRECLTNDEIDEILSNTRTEVLEECQRLTKVITDVIDGCSDLSELKQEQIRILIEKANQEETKTSEIQDALNSLLRLAEAADKDLNLEFFRELFVDIFELVLILVIKVKPSQTTELREILQNLKY